MKSVDMINQITKPKERFIKEYVCPDCNMTVTQKELVIPMGPRKGETVVANYGCVCADIKLAEEAKKQRKQLQNDKMKQLFDYYSLLNGALQEATLENYEPTSKELAKAKRDIESYIDNFDGKENLLLHGGYGTGKSHLSVAVTKKTDGTRERMLIPFIAKVADKNQRNVQQQRSYRG
ncbi:hypothetical protein RWE15_10205 [Virgibacillus halophilus]|uniref:IstB-like ATP binding protein n=1 Tax=Tigheibacillus halophilus TaxID=361280 RepID=A0ABU5C608_9BACI|nr:hypothetical protein [Virgibacillus halophilus]